MICYKHTDAFLWPLFCKQQLANTFLCHLNIEYNYVATYGYMKFVN